MNWRQRAACAGLPVAEIERLFFSGRGPDLVEGRVICLGCPVKFECLEDADAHEQGVNGDREHSTGLRGGLTSAERRKRRQARTAGAAA